MATWDGSEQAGPSDDPNFYMLARALNAAADPRAWDYYSPSVNAGYPRGVYSENSVGEALSANDNFQRLPHGEPSYEGAVHEKAIPPLDDRNCFFENNRQSHKLATSNSHNNRTPNNVQNESNMRKNRYASPRRESSLAKHSNLHAGASEFVPTGISKNVAKNTCLTSYNAVENSTYNNDYPNENSSSSSHIFYSDNRNRGNERRYDSPKSNNSYRANYKPQRSRNYEQSYTGANEPAFLGQESPSMNVQTDENSYRANPAKNSRPRNNHGRYNSDRYANNRQQRENPEKSRPDRRKIQVDTWQNSAGESYAATSNEEPRDNHAPGNNRGKWPRNDRKYQNDRFSSGNRQQNDKAHQGGNEHEEQNFDSPSTRREISHNRETERSYRNDRTRGRHRDGITNFDNTGASGSYYDHEADNHERDPNIKFERSRDDNKKLRDSRDQETQSWRQKDKIPNRATAKKQYSHKKIEFDDDASQRERLTELLNQGHLECLICCDYIRQNDPVWSCNNCYHVLHLKCLKKWAHSSQSENGWRCPACQNVSPTVPEIYYCFCGKARAPEWNRRDVAHSCGEICGRLRAKNNCVHKCTLLCHPGSCPECIAMVTRHCGCEKTSQSLKCSTTTLVVCDAVCEKLLNCKIHNCEKKCHHGDCGHCDKTLHQVCHCGKHERDVTCDVDVPGTYSCEEICDKLLECGNHRCGAICHPGSCSFCTLQPAMVTHCCCGQTPLTVERKTCLDPIPTCDKVCSKKLKCGQPSDPHTCKADCHPDDCPECELTTKVRCRCGNMDREIACKELRTKADDARCEKKCTKKRSCGKHKCNQPCCIDIEHICPMPCSKTLNCGRHRCQLCCHKGRCQPCQEMSFDELRCECGSAVVYPPVPCGTRRPTCNRPCTRQHSCGHEVLHNCHSDPSCPPCTVLTQRWCYGKHELRKAVPCHVNEISCGLPCNKPISCGRHKCITLCHSGPCEKSGQICVQPCTTAREMCGHICATPCHEGKCPDTPCKEMVKVTCTCGHRTMTRACAENSREFQRIASGILASKMADMQLGHSVDLEEVFGQGARKQNQLKTLECNDECKIIARNRRLALGLQIVNPDVSGKLMPRYTETMKQWAKKDPYFCQMVHDRLTELVQLAKTSKQKSRSHSFDSMNRDKRNFIHESCEHFGCESQAYDQEPKRNVVATAVKDKCWLPSYSLLEIVQRENGQRKVPRPMLNSSKPKSTLRLSEVLSSTARASQKLQPAASTSSKSPEPEIDYFDFPNSKPGKWPNA